MNALEKAQAFLRDLLASGPVSAAEVRARADSVGLSPRTLARAKDALEVESRRMPGGWAWALKDSVGKVAKDANGKDANGKDAKVGKVAKDAHGRVVPLRPGSPVALAEDRTPCARCIRLEAQVADLQARLARAESRPLPASWNAGQAGVRCDECQHWPAAQQSEWGNPWCKVGRTSIRRAHDRRKCESFEPMDAAELAKSRRW